MRSLLRSVRAAAPLVILLTLPLTVTAEDEPTAADRYAARTAALPAPSEEGAFSFEGDLVINGALSGTCAFSAVPAKAPGAPDGPMHWKTTDQLSAGEGALRVEHVAFLTSALSPVEGYEREMGNEGERTYAWRRTADGMEVMTTGEGLTPMTRRAPHEDPCLSTLSAVFLFSRLSLPEPAVYQTRSFNPGWDILKAETPFRDVTLEVKGEGAWADGRAYLVTGIREKAKLEAAFDLESRELLGARLHEEGGLDLRFVPKGSQAPPAGGDVLKSPAKTPEAAAARTGYALAAADLEVLEDVIHWPTLYEAMIDPAAEDSPTPEAFRAGILRGFEENLQPNPPAMMAGIVKSILDGGTLEVEKQGEDRAVVTFPPMFRSLKVKVGEVDGVWYLVELPGRPDR